jgi:hypothetical protein
VLFLWVLKDTEKRENKEEDQAGDNYVRGWEVWKKVVM